LNSLWPHRLAKILAGATFVLLVAGGLVTSTDSGLSVPDWPLSYGRFFPPMIGGIRYEHTHRLIALAVAVLTLALMAVLMKHEKRRWVATLGCASFFLVIAQAVLGGITVLMLLPWGISVVHACTAQTFFAVVCLLVLFTSSWWGKQAEDDHSAEPSSLKLCVATTFLIYLQLVLGAWVRHTGMRVAVGLHIILAFLILFLGIASGLAVLSSLVAPIAFLGGMTAFLVIVQFFLGIGALVATRLSVQGAPAFFANIFFPTAHQTLGAVILASSAVLTAMVARATRKDFARETTQG
jgi:cytochrome c oxidase assembly protein subunit 15